MEQMFGLTVSESVLVLQLYFVVHAAHMLSSMMSGYSSCVHGSGWTLSTRMGSTLSTRMGSKP